MLKLLICCLLVLGMCSFVAGCGDGRSSGTGGGAGEERVDDPFEENTRTPPGGVITNEAGEEVEAENE
jgi:hypothetical protein